VREVLSLRAQTGRPWLNFVSGKAAPVPLSFADADALASRWAGALHLAGVQAGDRVALLLPNGPDFIGAFFGAHELGATPVPLPWPVVPMGTLTLPIGAQAVLDVATPTVLVAPSPVTDSPLPVVTAPADGPLVHPRPLRSSAPAFV
jgi:acyl-CoA synthetase (AMP-forming)/AMP-acid ligase II